MRSRCFQELQKGARLQLEGRRQLCLQQQMQHGCRRVKTVAEALQQRDLQEKSLLLWRKAEAAQAAQALFDRWNLNRENCGRHRRRRKRARCWGLGLELNKGEGGGV
jgi:hypothetical protein